MGPAPQNLPIQRMMRCYSQGQRSLKQTPRGQAICRGPRGVIPEQARFVSAKRFEPCLAAHCWYRSRLVVGNHSACVSTAVAKREFVARMRPCYQKV